VFVRGGGRGSIRHRVWAGHRQYPHERFDLPLRTRK
jgi:hypothetical protein